MMGSDTMADGAPPGVGETRAVGSADDEGFGRVVGERLRAIRRQKRLSLQDVEQVSDKEFKASVLGAYERGERSLSVPRLARLASIYRVPVDQLLPEVSPAGMPRGDDPAVDDDPKVRLDLTRLENMAGPEAEMISRYVNKIQVQRQDFNGRVMTIRGDDLRFIACILGVPDRGVRERLAEMRLQLPTEPVATHSQETV